MSYFEKVVQVADTYVANKTPEKLAWSWGEALAVYSLFQLDETLGEERYLPFYKAYADHHYEKGVVVDQSDTCAPALLTNALYMKTGEAKYREMTEAGIYYLKNEPRLVEDLISHNGRSKDSRDYPKSVWVDSLMMSGVFSAIAADTYDDDDLREFAKTQPRQFAKYLQDPESKLFHHSWWRILKRPYPRGLFWARGNGWVVASLSMFLDHIDDADAKRILQEVSDSLLSYQRTDHYFDTVINKPGDNYRESSATALIAAGWLNAANKGYLDEKFGMAGANAFRAVVDNLRIEDTNAYMTEISLWTIPMFLKPYSLKRGPYPGYKYVRKGENIPYGVAALILAAINYREFEARSK